MNTMALRDLAMQVAGIAQDAGKHALTDQITPKDLARLDMAEQDYARGLDVDRRLNQFIRNRLTYVAPFQGTWEERPGYGEPGSRYWCIGGIDGVINYSRNMAEWAVTISLFEFNEFGDAQPIIGIVHVPALALTYLAARREGAIRIRRTPLGEKREKIMPSTTRHLDGSVVSFGMSTKPEESKHALNVVYHLAGRPADIKRVGPASLDLCKVADGTYDAYFEPHLHQWDVPAISAAAVVIWEAEGKLRAWNGDAIDWRQENDVVASNGLIIDELRPYLLDELNHTEPHDA